MDKTTLINRATAVTVALVAVFAAIISYTHIYSLARLHHAPVADAGLTPLVTDGLILASSLVLLYAAKHKLDTPKIAHVTLWLGIVATLAANVAYGLAQGWESALIDSWPAVAFIGSVEAVMQLAKAKRVASKRQLPAEPSLPKALPAVPVTSKTSTIVKVPTVRQIRDHLKPCGQPRAQQIQKIIREQGLTIDEADKQRMEVKLGG